MSAETGDIPTRYYALAVTRLDLTFDAIHEAFIVASKTTAADALDHLADYMNGCDAVQDVDAEVYEAWAARGRP